jgi:hypothetical protein
LEGGSYKGTLDVTPATDPYDLAWGSGTRFSFTFFGQGAYLATSFISTGKTGNKYYGQSGISESVVLDPFSGPGSYYYQNDAFPWSRLSDFRFSNVVDVNAPITAPSTVPVPASLPMLLAGLLALLGLRRRARLR